MRTGIRRKVDDLGRVVIPAGIRRSVGIREGDAVEFHVEGEQVILAKPIDQCVFCGEAEGVEEFRDRPVCPRCVGELADRRDQGSPSTVGSRDKTIRSVPDLDDDERRQPDDPSSAPEDRGDQDPPASTTAW
jgi:AbrB family transcriptional regulator, transcriptional pleiotropic regulator of transition state genes